MMPNNKEHALRLQKKLEHWIAHNKEQAESFRKAAKEAEGLGLVEVSSRLNEAAEKMEEVAVVLEAALNASA